METTKPVLGNGIQKTSARAIAVYVDENNNTWICDKDVVGQIDPSRPFAEQNIARCGIMPFDHGG